MKKSFPYYSLLAFGSFFFVIFSAYFYHQVGDDSFIYYRYVERALVGKYWSWTDQIAAVEGYSSPLWYGLLILLAKCGMAVTSAAKVLGLFATACSVLLMLRLGHVLQLSRMQAAAASCLVIFNTGFHYWSSAGLETALYTAVYLWAVIAMVQCRHWWMPLALIGILRPEGPILLLALLICMKWLYAKKITLAPVLLALLPCVLWLAWRLYLYELPLPNTFYAKATGELTVQLRKGIFYSLPVLLPLLWAWWHWSKQRDSAVMIVLGAITLLLGIVVIGGGDWMFHFRLLQPVLPLIWLAVFVLHKNSGVIAKVLLGFSLLPLLLLSISPWHIAQALQFKSLDTAYYQEGYLSEASFELADIIQQRYGDGLLIAVNHAGVLPFALADDDFIDMIGLNDKHIAQVKGEVHNKFDMDYVLEQRPDLIILNSRTKPGTDGVYYHAGYWSGETALLGMAEFQAHYSPADIAVPWHWKLPFPYSLFVTSFDSWIIVYKRNELQ